MTINDAIKRDDYKYIKYPIRKPITFHKSQLLKNVIHPN